MLSATPAPAAQPLGLRQSFGFGDRLGLATSGHLAAARRFGFGPVFAQASIREMERLRRTQLQMIADTRAALGVAGFRGAWGADVSGVKTEGDIDRAIAAGFTWFTFDPSGFIEPRAAHLEGAEIEAAVAEIVNEGVLPADWKARYGDGHFAVDDNGEVTIETGGLERVAVKFARAIQQVQRLVRRLTQHAFSDGWEIEIDLTGAGTSTTPLEHLFVALELKRRGFPAVALAPRFAVPFEPGVDLSSAPAAFEAELAVHAAIARTCGPYKISIHDCGDKFSILPVIGRVCRELMHVKTSELGFLEALRLVCRALPELFREITTFARQRFEEDSGLSGILTTTVDDLDPLFKPASEVSLENAFLGTVAGRQMLLAAGMPILTAGRTSRDRPFRQAIAEIVADDPVHYRQLVDDVCTRHLTLLNQG